MAARKKSGQSPHTNPPQDDPKKASQVGNLERTTELLGATIDAAPAAIVGLDLEGRVQSIWNKAAEKMFGWTAEEAMGKILPTVPNDKRDEFHKLIELVKTNGAINGVEVQRQKRDGAPIDYAVYASPLHGPGGEFAGLVAVLVDITERKRVERALRDSEERFRIVFENVLDGISIYEEDIDPAKRRLIDCNEKYAAMAGQSRDELLKLGNTLPLQKNLNDSADIVRLLNLSVGTACKGAFSWVRPDGKENIIEYITVPVKWRGKSYSIGIDRDVTEQRTAEALLRDSEQKFRMLTDSTTSAIFIYQEDKISYVNPACIDLTGYTETELVGKNYWELIHPDSREKVKARLQARQAGKNIPTHMEVKTIAKSGEARWVDFTTAIIEYQGAPAVLGTAYDITSRKKFEEELWLQSLTLNAAANSIVITDREGRIEWANRAFETSTGYTSAESIGKDHGELIKSGKQNEEFYRKIWETILSGDVWHGEIINQRKDKSLYTEEMTITPVPGENDEVEHFIAVKQDVTDRKLLETQLTQMQKLEAIGRLAGGVAHDYNNVLGVVIGYGQIIKDKTDPGDPRSRYADLILSSARRGADLTRQLLAFARKEIVSPKPLDVNSSIESLRNMLVRIIGENFNLVFNPGSDIWTVRIDPSQFDQILFNLGTNAIDTVENVGTITITTCNVVLDEAFARIHVGVSAGEYVKLSFSDTGRGMDQETLKKIFDPFFATKPKGQGLGLATIYRVVQQNGGAIDVISKLGEGTEFDIYFPRYAGQGEIREEHPTAESLKGGEMVLVVEDQAELLELTKTILEKYGYKVLTALDPGEAVLISKAYPDRIDLLLTDVVMPTMNGKNLSENIRELRPEIRTLFMSGFGEDVLQQQGIFCDDSNFIKKPFAPDLLAKKVKEVLS